MHQGSRQAVFVLKFRRAGDCYELVRRIAEHFIKEGYALENV